MSVHSFARPLAVTVLAILCLFAEVQAGDRNVPVPINTPMPNDVPALTADEVTTIIGQAVAFLKAAGESGTIAVVDREGHILAIFRMTKSDGPDIRIDEQATVKARTAAFFQSNEDAFSTRTAQFIVQANFPPGVDNLDAGPLFGVPFSNFPKGDGLLGAGGPLLTDVQLQVPPFIVFVGGVNAFDLNGARALTFPAGNINRRPALQPLVITPLTDDLGGLPLYKAGRACGAVGVEIDAFGVLQEGTPDAGIFRTDTGKGPPNEPKPRIEEQAALAAQRGFAPSRLIRGDRILVNGFRFLYVGKSRVPRNPAIPLAGEGAFQPYIDTNESERAPNGGLPPGGAYPAGTPAVTLPAAPRATPTQEFPRRGFVPRFPPRDSPLGAIRAEDVVQIVQQGANKAIQTRAAIRKPNGVPAQVWICVTDLAGNVCGSFRTEDATPFSFDVHVQKSRTAAFFSTDDVGFSSRGVGFMAQTLYPPGVDTRPPGPISGMLNFDNGLSLETLGAVPNGGVARLTEISQVLMDRDGTPLVQALATGPSLFGGLNFAVRDLAARLPHVRDGRLSPLQVGITVDLSLGRPTATGFSTVPTAIPNGITIFPGGVPMFKNGVLVGGVGISGDGVDQDDIIAFAAQQGFTPPPGKFCDEASQERILTALRLATTKLKTQFPNLTNGITAGDQDSSSSAVLDVIERRLTNGPFLEGLRIPYVKFPRAPNAATGD